MQNGPEQSGVKINNTDATYRCCDLILQNGIAPKSRNRFGGDLRYVSGNIQLLIQ